MHFTKFATLAAALITLASAQSDEAPIPGYGIADFVWEVNPFVGGNSIIVTGTVQDVVAAIKKINPAYEVPTVPEISLVKRGEIRGLTRRSRVECGRFPYCNAGRIQEGVNYLRGVGGRPRNGPGPGNCGRVSCSYKAAIWWCNDNRSTKELNSFNDIANSAQHTKNTCTSGPNLVAGQNFEDGNWNTIVREDNC